MNKFTFQTIRAGLVFGLAIFMATGTAFASVSLIPAGATEITGTSATLNGQVVNEGKNSYVWLEWADNSALYGSTIVGKQAFWSGGSFDAKIDGLTPGATYYYRAVVVARPITGAPEAPVYSPVVSFRTTAPKAVVATTGNSSTQTYSNSNNSSTQNNSTTRNQTNTTNTVNRSNTSNTNTNTNTSSNSKNNSGFNNNGKQNANGSADGFTNNGSNSASVVGSGLNIFPVTLTGWIILLIALFVILLIVRLIYEESEKRKKARLAKKAAEAAALELAKA